jgi:hypothetical protein
MALAKAQPPDLASSPSAYAGQRPTRRRPVTASAARLARRLFPTQVSVHARGRVSAETAEVAQCEIAAGSVPFAHRIESRLRSWLNDQTEFILVSTATDPAQHAVPSRALPGAAGLHLRGGIVENRKGWMFWTARGTTALAPRGSARSFRCRAWRDLAGGAEADAADVASHVVAVAT